jgi:hypothetical protein
MDRKIRIKSNIYGDLSLEHSWHGNCISRYVLDGFLFEGWGSRMMKKSTVLILFIVLSSAGCATSPPLTSLYPIVPVENAFLDPTIVGTWTVENTGETWEFFLPKEKKEGDEGEYPWFLTVTDEMGQESLYWADLDMLGDATVLQVYPAYHLSGDFEMDLLFYLHAFTLPLYRIYRAQISDHEFVLTELDSRRINKHLVKRPEAVKHQLVKGRLMLMAPPAQTRTFLLDRMKDSDALWSRKVLRMTRLKAVPETASEVGAP